MDQTATRMTTRIWGLLALLGLIWGGSFFFARVAVAHVPPATLVLARVGIAALALHLYMPAASPSTGRCAPAGANSCCSASSTMPCRIC